MRAARLLSTVLSVALVLELMAYAIAHSADVTDCNAYANRGSAAALQQLLRFPFVDVAAGRFLYRKAFTFCVNSDEMPPLVFTPEEQPIVDGMPTPPTRPELVPGSVPATDKVEATPPDLSAAYKKCAAAHPRGYRASDHTFTKLTRGKWLRALCP
jgi:hypothetical protein